MGWFSSVIKVSLGQGKLRNKFTWVITALTSVDFLLLSPLQSCLLILSPVPGVFLIPMLHFVPKPVGCGSLLWSSALDNKSTSVRGIKEDLKEKARSEGKRRSRSLWTRGNERLGKKGRTRIASAITFFFFKQGMQWEKGQIPTCELKETWIMKIVCSAVPGPLMMPFALGKIEAQVGYPGRTEEKLR